LVLLLLQIIISGFMEDVLLKKIKIWVENYWELEVLFLQI